MHCMAAITISREYGSRGAAIGARVAERLGWRYVDDDLIFLVAYRAGIPAESVRAYDQEVFSRLRTLAHDCVAMLEAPGPPVLGQTVGRPDEIEMPLELRRFYSSRYLRLVQQVILALAASGRVVIMGRGAQVLLHGLPWILHVRTVAPRPVRVGRVAEDEALASGEAARRIRRRDHAVARYLRHFYGVDWEDPLLYHLILNTGALTEEEATRLVLQAAPVETEPAGQARPGAKERSSPRETASRTQTRGTTCTMDSRNGRRRDQP
jgi:cytidylate kinase